MVSEQSPIPPVARGLTGVLRAVENRDEQAALRALARLSDADLALAEATVGLLNAEVSAEQQRRETAGSASRQSDDPAPDP